MNQLILLGIPLLFCGQCGCTQLPPVGSLERMHFDEQRHASRVCYQVYSRRYPHVPTRDVINGCRRAYGLGYPTL